MTDISALEQRLAALKARSYKLSSDAQREADLARLLNEEEARLDREGANALEAHVEGLEADAHEKHPGVQLISIYEWSVHKATASDKSSIEGILRTGRGVIIVKAATGKAAIKCAQAYGKSADLFVTDIGTVGEVLRNAAVYPPIAEINAMCSDDELRGLTCAATREAATLAGVYARTTAGKLKS